jgi:hypothetical protein
MPNTIQTYENHTYFPRLTAYASAFLILALVAFGLRWFLIGGRLTMAVGILFLIACNLVLITIGRVYTTNLQDRIIRLEMRLRCASLMTPEQQRMLAELPIKKVAALRFASDEELPALCERASRERLSVGDIKRAVKRWVPDYHRT